ncbi:MAG: hypothetical protein ACTSPG_06780 [Candidatus Hodarchaeales archaeon]
MIKDRHERKNLGIDDAELKYSMVGDKSEIKGSKLMVILSDEGGLPIYTRFIQVDNNGEINTRFDSQLDPKSEPIMLMSGLIEAITQLKEVVKPTLLEIAEAEDRPIYVDFAKNENGVALVSLSTTPDFQNLPVTILSQYGTSSNNLHDPSDFWDKGFERILNNKSLSEDVAIYRRILGQIKRELAEIVSFILVYDDKGEYLFSTAKNQNQGTMSDTLVNMVSKYIKREYGRGNHRSIIGAKTLGKSILWHFKCFDRIFVMLTYRMPEMHTFHTMKSDIITFIANNIESFITASEEFSKELKIRTKNYRRSRFVFLS